MVEIGSLEIGGSINTEEIERGLKSVERGFDDVAAKGKSVESDFIRIDSSAKSLAGSLGLIGAATGLIALAKSAPSVAGDMAKIQLAFDSLTRSLGTALKPAFEWFSGKLNDLSSWVQEHPDLTASITTGIIALSAALVAFKIGTAFVGLLTFLSSAPVIAIAGTILGIYQTYKALKDLASEDPKTPGKDIGSIIGGVIGGVAMGAAAIASGVGIPLTAAAIATGYAGGSYVGGKVGGLFDTEEGTYSVGGQMYSGTNKSQSVDSATNALIKALNNASSRKNATINGADEV